MKLFKLRVIITVSLFGMFLPFGYLPWFWSVPMSILSALYFIAATVKSNEEIKKNKTV
jgi:ABC-type multidrug transport system permease subunit